MIEKGMCFAHDFFLIIYHPSSIICLLRRQKAKTVPETDTGGQVEYTKALERTMLKELGKLHA